MNGRSKLISKRCCQVCIIKLFKQVKKQKIVQCFGTIFCVYFRNCLTYILHYFVIMFKLTCFCTCIFFTQVIAAQIDNKSFIPASDTNIQYVGRFDFTDKTNPAFMYSGCMIRTAFTGTSLQLHLRDDSLRNWFTVKLDDSVFAINTNAPAGLYILAKDLPDTTHYVQLSRRTEWHGGNTIFSGFEIDKGKKLLPLPSKKRSIEFIGNSITCGCGNEGRSREEHFSYATENNYLTYGCITARNLDADYIAVCRSGIGMYQAYDGNKNFVQPLLYDEIAVNSKAKWDYKNNEPAVVIIELGANDLAKPLDSSAFVEAYIGFVNKIRNNYPDAAIVCAAGPNEESDTSLRFQSLVRAVTDHFSPGDKSVYYFSFSAIESNGSDWHPDLRGHQLMANELTPFLKKILR